jgi:hypothetical protein
MFVYRNNGLDFQGVFPDYVVQAGEVIFPDIATPSQLTAAFPGYTAAYADLQALLASNRSAVTVSRAQLLIALSEAGLLAQVQTSVAAAPTSTQLLFANFQVATSNSPSIQALATAAGISSAQLTAVFQTASQLTF